MSLLFDEAKDLGLDDLRLGVIEELITEDDMWLIMPFRKANSGKAHAYNREGVDLQTGELRNLTSNFRLPGDTITEGTGETDDIIVRVKAIIDDSDVDAFVRETMSGQNNLVAITLGQRAKTTGRLFRKKLINGGVPTTAVDAAHMPNMPAGFLANPKLSFNAGSGHGILRVIIATNMISYKAPEDDKFGAAVDYTGDPTNLRVFSDNPTRWIDVAVTTANEGLADLDIVVLQDENPEFPGLLSLVASPQRVDGTGGTVTFTGLDELHDLVPRAMGQAVHISPAALIRQYKGLLRTVGGGVDAAMLTLENFGRPILTSEGEPVLKNEFIPEVASESSWFKVALNEDVGFTGLYAGDHAGIAVQNLGPRATKDADGWRVKFYGGCCLYSTKALAEYHNVDV